MSNTAIILKKSGTTGNTPASLLPGEVALNYADGKLFYKDANNVIQSIRNQNTFGTINVNSTLIVSSSTDDILTVNAGNNISISADSIGKSITINAIEYLSNGDASLTNTTADQVVDSFDKTVYGSAKYFIQATKGSDIHCTEVVLMCDGTNVYKNEYGTMYSNVSLISVSATLVSDTLSLVVTPTNNNTTVDFSRISLTSRI